MVDGIGWKAIRPVERVGSAAPVAAAARSAASTPALDEVATTGIVQQLAAAPPVDLERVARIKKAIADGNFPIVSSTIADRLLALKLEWNPNDQA